MMTDKEADSKLSRRGGHVQSGHYGHGAKHDDEQHEWSAIDWNDPDSGAIWGGGGARASDSVTADFREATGDGSGPSLPSGLALVNAELEFEEGDDGAGALVLPEGAYLKLTMPKPAVFSWGGGGWGGGGGGAWGQPAKPDDGQIHSWSMMLAVQLESLPSAPMPLLNGGMAAAMGEKVEHVQVYKNGGVGALGNMGVHAAAVRAGRWAWVSLTRSDSCLTTYVNGVQCAQVSLGTKTGEEGEQTSLHPHAIMKCEDESVAKRRSCNVCQAKGVAFESVAEGDNWFLCRKCYDEKVKPPAGSTHEA